MSGALVLATRAELIKFRAVRSTFVTLGLVFLVSVAIGALEGWSVRGAIQSHSPLLRTDFTAAQAGFDGALYGQLALIVFGVLAVTNEYGSGLIGISLLAVPRRGLLYMSKAIAVALTAAAAAVPSIVAGFVVFQFALGPYGVSLSSPGVLQAAAGAVAYLVLMTLLAAGFAWAARNAILPLAVLLPLVLAGSQILSVIGATAAIAQYLPDRAGMRMLAIGPSQANMLSPLVGFLVLTAWTALSLTVGYVLLTRRDP